MPPSRRIFDRCLRSPLPLSGLALLPSVALCAAGDPPAWLPVDALSRQLTLLVAVAGVLIALLLIAHARRGRELVRLRVALRAALAERDPVLAALPELISLKDPHGTYLSCNDAFAELFDCRYSDVLGRRDSDFVDLDTARRWRSGDRAAIAAGDAVVTEEWLALRERDFTALIEYSRRPLYDDNGRLSGVLCVARDVTARHREEQERHKRASYQRALLDNFPFQVWLKDTRGRILAANRAFADAVGVDHPRDLLNRTDDELLSPEQAALQRREDRQVMATRQRVDGEIVVETPQGQAFFESYRAPVIDDRGSVLGTVGFTRDITQRHAIEQALRDSERRFRAFFENHSAMLVIIDPDSGVIVDANGAAEGFFGYPRSTLIGMPTGDINTLPAEQVDTYRQQVVAGTRDHFEVQYRLADGALRDVDVYAAAVDFDGRPLLLAIIHDITERKRMRRELEREHELFASGPVVVVTWGAEDGWPVRKVSGNCERILGHTPEQLLEAGFHFADLIHPDDLVRVRDEVEHWLTQHVDRFEQSYRVRHGSGDYVWLQEFSHVIRDADGTVDSLRGYLVDRSQAKQLEAALEEQGRCLRHVIEGTGAGTWEWNVQTGETRFNERWAEIIGYRLNELVPVSIDTWLEHAHPDDLKRSEAALQDHFNGKTELYRCEARMRHKDGRWVWVSDRGRVFEWTDDGQPLWMYGTHVDITERKQAEAALRDNEDRLRMAGLATFDLLYEWHVASGRLHWFGDVDRQLGFQHGTVGDRLETWLALIHPDDRRQLNEAVTLHSTSTEAYEYRYRVRQIDGSYRSWLDRAIPVLDDQGRPQKWVGVCTDVTERQQAEERRRLAVTVFHNTHEGILVTDANAHIIDVNPAFTAITGYSREEALGRNPRFLSSGHQDQAFYRTLWSELDRDGRWSGEIWNRRKDGRVYAEKLSISAIHDNDGNVTRYVALFSDITKLKEQQTQLERIAYYDALTDLPNRVMLGDRLDQAMRHAERHASMLAVVYLDLDGFKEINDAYGHDTGDEVLVTLAGRMLDVLRSDDTLARLGGDEFVAILSDLHEPANCVELLPRLLEAVARPLEIGEHRAQVSASLGVALYPQSETLDPDQLLRQADQAMYQAKLAGKNGYHFFDTEQDQSIRGQVEQIAEVRAALDNQEFVLFYQPKVNMRSGDVIGVEALIRWPQPDGGMRAPAEFLPLIEHNELAAHVDHWVIDQALGQLERWQATGLKLTVSVNVSAYHLQQADFVDRLCDLLTAHPGVAPEQLTIEVLETTALMDLARMSEVIRTAQAMGVAFALDDFGTGYSSLDYLKSLPARQLKIDRSFVRDMLDDRDDLAILEGIVGLANAFSRDLVAEGVESAEHGEILLRLGCEVAQGFGIGRPMPAAQLDAWIAGWQPDSSWRDQTRISRDDLPLVFAMVEHRAWRRTLKASLDSPQRPFDAHHRAFGHWLNGPSGKRYSRHGAFVTVRKLFAETTATASRVIELRDSGQSDAAGEASAQLERVGDRLIDALKALLHDTTRNAA